MWFGWAVLWPVGQAPDWGAAAVAVAAFVLLQRCKWDVLPVIGLAAVVGVLRWAVARQ